jgi:hypothetical protein
MKPDVDQVLGTSAAQLTGTLAPLLPGAYAMGSAALLGIMMMLSAQEYDRAADIRAAENADMRALFRECAASIDDAALKSKLLHASQTRDNSLKISMLNAENYELRRVLIALQTHCEDKGLRDIERRIWSVLKASAERRLLKLG